MKRWRSLSASQRVAAVTSAAAVAVWTAVWVVPDVHEAAPDAAPVEPERAEPAAPAPEQLAPKQPSVEPAVPAQAAEARAPEQVLRPAQPTADPLLALRQGLASDNAGTRIAAVRRLAEQRTDEALPELLALDVARDPALAPTLIQVTAQLAQRAQSPQRAAAATQLARWLKSETDRPSVDARGNVSVLVEALGGLRSPEAESALITVLQSDQPLHVQTLAVEGLGRFASVETQAALQQFRAQLAQTERQGFEQELQREAQNATDQALARLSRKL